MYKIGDKVETPLGVGVVTKVSESNVVWVAIKLHHVWFEDSVLKPYTSAHDKLIALGYELDVRENFKRYIHDELATVRVDNDKTISCYEITLELAKIITQYLEEIEDE